MFIVIFYYKEVNVLGLDATIIKAHQKNKFIPYIFVIIVVFEHNIIFLRKKNIDEKLNVTGISISIK